MNPVGATSFFLDPQVSESFVFLEWDAKMFDSTFPFPVSLL